MLEDLKKVQGNFYHNDNIAAFLKAHPIGDIIKLLNKTNKAETKSRLRQFFYKLNESDLYKEFILEGLNQNAQAKAQFRKYIASQNSQQYFELIQKKPDDVLALFDSNPVVVPMIFSLVHSRQFGIKMVKLFSQLYYKHSDHNSLYTEQIKQQLYKGLKSEDSVVQMRFVQIVANIAIHGGKSFQFVKQALTQSLNIYQTQDILLKLNIVQVISVLGQGRQTSELLRGHKVWSKVQKDAVDVNQEFYIRKSLFILLIDMSVFQQYQITPIFTKNLIQFLNQCYKGNGQNLQGGLQIAAHLFKSNDGAKIVIQNSQVFNSYLKLSRSPQDRIKNLFVDNMTVLTDKTNGKKTKPLILNVLSCVGNPNLSNQLSHNIHSNNFIAGGIDGFCKWFVGLLQLPFEDLQIKLLGLFINLLEYTEVCEQLFENQSTTKYILKPVGKSNTTKVLKAEKNRLVHRLIEKGAKQWKNTKLQQYAVMIQKQLQKQKMQMEIQMEAA